MQIIPVYLYPNIIDAQLDLDNTVRGVNTVMYQRDLKIQKSLKNQIRIQFKNSDQKKVRIYNTQTFVFSMFDSVNQQLVLSKNLEIIDANTTATKGLALLTLSESDTADLNKGSYNYAIKMQDATGSFVPTYSNAWHDVAGVLHLENAGEPIFKESTVITTFTKSYIDQNSRYEHSSGNIYAQPEYNGNNAIQTVAYYMTAYRGTVRLEGTLDNSPGASGNYTLIATRGYDNFTGVDTVNFTGVYSYVRFIHIPNQGPGDPDNDNPSYYGSFDKVLYRS